MPGRPHSGFEVWPYAFQVLPPPSSRKGSFDPDPRASVHTFEASVWDLAALDILVGEAGGAFTSRDGTAGPHGGSAVATNGLLHQQVLSRLRGA